MLTSKSTVWLKNKSIFYNNVFFLGNGNDGDFPQSIEAREKLKQGFLVFLSWLQEGVKTSNRFPCSLTEVCAWGGSVGVWAYSVYGVRVGVCPGIWPAGWLKWCALLVVVLSAAGMWSTLLLFPSPSFCSSSSETAVCFLSYLYLLV